MFKAGSGHLPAHKLRILGVNGSGVVLNMFQKFLSRCFTKLAPACWPLQDTKTARPLFLERHLALWIVLVDNWCATLDEMSVLPRILSSPRSDVSDHMRQASWSKHKLTSFWDNNDIGQCPHHTHQCIISLIL